MVRQPAAASDKPFVEVRTTAFRLFSTIEPAATAQSSLACRLNSTSVPATDLEQGWPNEAADFAQQSTQTECQPDDKSSDQLTFASSSRPQASRCAHRSQNFRSVKASVNSGSGLDRIARQIKGFRSRSQN